MKSYSLAALQTKFKLYELRAKSLGIAISQKEDEDEVDPALLSQASSIKANTEHAQALFVQQTQLLERTDHLFNRLDEIVKNACRIITDESNNLNNDKTQPDAIASGVDKSDNTKQYHQHRALSLSSLSVLEAEAETFRSNAKSTFIANNDTRIHEVKYLFTLARAIIYMITSTAMYTNSPLVAFQLSSESIIDLFEIITKEEEVVAQEEERKGEKDKDVTNPKGSKIKAEGSLTRKDVESSSVDATTLQVPSSSNSLRLLRLGFFHAVFWIIRGLSTSSFSYSTCVADSEDACLLSCERQIDKSITLLTSLIEISIDVSTKTTGESTKHTTFMNMEDDSNKVWKNPITSGEQAVDYHLDDSSSSTSLSLLLHSSSQLQAQAQQQQQQQQHDKISTLSSFFSSSALLGIWNAVYIVVSIPEPVTKSEAKQFLRKLYTSATLLRANLTLNLKRTIIHAILHSNDEYYPPLSSSSLSSSCYGLHSAACGAILYSEGFSRGGISLLTSGDRVSETKLKQTHIALILLCRTMAYVSSGIDCCFEKAIQSATVGLQVLEKGAFITTCKRYKLLCARFYILRALSICRVLDRGRRFGEGEERGNKCIIDCTTSSTDGHANDAIRQLAVTDSKQAGILFANEHLLSNIKCSCASESLQQQQQKRQHDDDCCVFSSRHRHHQNCSVSQNEQEEDLIAEHILLDMSLNRPMSSQRSLSRIIGVNDGDNDEVALSLVKARVASL
jgi:hypothetical protein